MVKKATIDQYLQLGHMVSAGAISRELMQAILEERIEIIGESRGRITVPNLSAAELIAQAQSKLELTLPDPDLAKWRFVTDEAGKTYEVQSWKPGREVVPATEVRAHFTDGFVGNTAAFIALMTRDNPEGYHATIPADDRLFRSGGGLYAPYFFRDGSHRELSMYDGVRIWRVGFLCCWAFRPLK